MSTSLHRGRSARRTSASKRRNGLDSTRCRRPSVHPFGKSKYFKEPPVNSGYRIPRSPAMPQHGIPEPVTSSAHFSASFVNVCSTPSFLDEHGTWMAMCFFHFVELELIEQVVRDEFRWLIQGKSQGWVLQGTLDFRQARRGIDDDRVLAVFRRF